MSCFNSNCYLPRPPRAWSRVQNECSVVTSYSVNPDDLVRVPYSKQLVIASELKEKLDMLNKGNILQYKANSGNLTKNMKYSKIAQGQWTNRNTTWATQSTRGYTNPNITSLKRVGKVNIAFDSITRLPLGPTLLPVTCLQFDKNNYPALPSTGGGGTIIVIPPQPNNPIPSNNDNFIPEVPSEAKPDPIVIQDEGVLICSIQEDICTGFTKQHLSQQLCNPTTDSNVPGRIQDLCWNDGTPTWYPRQRYTMSNSGNKWPYTTGPEDTTTISAVRPFSPVITFISANCNSNTVTLFWEQNETCLPVSSFLIYQNDVLIKIADGFERSTELTIENDIEYSYFIISKSSGSNNLISDPSITKTLSKTSVQINQTVPGTYTYSLPKGATCYDVTVIGGGGGGGSGVVLISGNPQQGCIGGSGGGAGGFSTSNNINISSQTIFNYTVGQGGTRGDYSDGSPGTLSSFSDGLSLNIKCNGGTGGKYNTSLYPSGNNTTNPGGIGGSASGGLINISGGNGGDSGGIGTPTANNTGFVISSPGFSGINSAPGGGGGAGCIFNTGTSDPQAVYYDSVGAEGGNGGNGALGGIVNQYADSGDGTGTLGYGGSGGGGGSGNRFSSSGTITGNGGNGIYGSGGGGGGSSHTLSNSHGRGGNGGDGVVCITIYILNIPDDLTYTSSLKLSSLSESTRKKGSISFVLPEKAVNQSVLPEKPIIQSILPEKVDLKKGILPTVENIKTKITNTSIINTTTYYEQPSTGYIELPIKPPKNGVVQICNQTDSELIIKSSHIIYNIVFAMNGKKKIRLPSNTVANFTYLTDPKGNINVQAHIF